MKDYYDIKKATDHKDDVMEFKKGENTVDGIEEALRKRYDALRRLMALDRR